MQDFLAIFIPVFGMVGGGIFFLANRNPAAYRAKIWIYLFFLLMLAAVGLALGVATLVSSGKLADSSSYAHLSVTALFLSVFCLVVRLLFRRGASRAPASSTTDQIDETDLANAGNSAKFRILLIGDEYVGKTQLIQAINSVGTPVPALDRTSKFIEVAGPIISGEQVIFYDCRGQDLGSISKGIKKYNLSNRDINGIIFAVDTFSIPNVDLEDKENSEIELEKERGLKYEIFSESRIRKHHSKLGEGFFELFFEKVKIFRGEPFGLKGIALFINKMDKWEHWSGNTSDEEALGKFRKITTRIQAACYGEIEPVCIAGSALSGAGVVGAGSLQSAISRWIVARSM